jgi:hypothetical protein
LATLNSNWAVADTTELERLAERIAHPFREAIESAFCTGAVDNSGDQLESMISKNQRWFSAKRMHQ